MAKNVSQIERSSAAKNVVEKASTRGRRVTGVAEVAKPTQVTEVPKPRSTRGRKAEAIKEFIPPVAKKYRTRKDYMGEGWAETYDNAIPQGLNSLKRAVSFEATNTVKRVIDETAAQVKAKADQQNTQTTQASTVTVNNSMKNDTHPMAAEFAYNLMDLCSKYIFVMKGAFDGKDGISEIDIHIKVKPSTSFSGTITC